MYTKQEAFNKVWQHFIVDQNPPGFGVNGCAYRTQEGNRCAIGCLIPDEEYKPTFDEGSISTKDVVFLVSNLNNEDYDFYLSLQVEHDRWAKGYIRDFESQLRFFAKLNNLTIPE